MALEKKTSIDRFEVRADGRVDVCLLNCIMESGSEVARGIYRVILDPAVDTETTVSQKVGTTDGMINRATKAAWTKEVVDARKAARSAPSRMGVAVTR